ncbi:probable cytochrome P450 4aa1 [Anoplophora glabripennis]|uniref:probable cytochrome P450 4aa1 n=1 Tax=Anoplophora glabripennis TaxID=217634 RepID=UPI000C77938F|nr:probable cytochrome P450 4aa1 [Anoplophora glabripennis]
MEYISCLIILSAIYVLYCCKTYIRTVCLSLSLPGPTALPVLGNVLILNNTKKLEEVGTKAYQLYGPFFRSWVSVIPFFFIYEPRHLKIILAGKNSQKNVLYKLLHNFVGRGLITNNGEKWKTHRKLIQPYFHINILENYINTFSESTKELLSNLEEDKDIKITPVINKCILSILHKAVLGVSLKDEMQSPYRKGEVLLTQRITKPWLLLETIFKYTPFAKTEEKQKLSLHLYTKNIMDRRRNEAIKTPSQSLLDMFIEISENNPDFTDEDIINEIVTFMLAGQDSVGAAVAFSLYYIAKDENIQSKIVEELDAVFEKAKPSVATLHNLKYLEQCIKESLRLAPSVPIISRILTEDVTLDERTFPAGSNIFISPFITHRLPHHYPDPLKFDPERFSQEEMDKRHPFAYIPFSMGQRNCIGYKFALLEVKIVLAGILKTFQINIAPGHENLDLVYRATLRTSGGVWLHLTRRK